CRKSLRANANISLMAQRRLLPQGRLNFMFNYYNFIPSMKLFGTDIKLKAYPQVQDGPVQFVVHEQDGWVELNLIYLADLFSDLGFLYRMELLSDQILKGVKQIDQLELRLPEEQEPIPVEGVSAEMLPFETVVHGFVEQVQKTPHSIAVKHGGDQLSYIELHNMSGALAAKLAASGVVSGSKVGICLDRGMDMLVSVLAVLKCGAAYVPMDSAYPSERLAYILNDSSAPVLITQQCVRERMEQAGTQIQATVLELDSDTSWRDSIAIDSEVLPKAADPIYVIYTSGSTGKPKGAEVTHAGEINLQSWYISALGVSESDRFLLVSAFGFDLTQKNLFAPLLVGGRLVIPDMDDYDIGVVAKTISDESITVVNCAPSAFYPLVDDGSLSGYPYQSLRYVVLGGEPIRLPLLADWLTLGQCRLVNSYGPTECTDVVAFHQYQPDQDGDELPIGKAICNTQLYIVDSANHQLPPGVVGELCIAGAGVGLGYVNKPELTGAVFEPNPFGDGRWYRTGDLVRMRLDGSIDYIGRKDFQVKMRGLRIELGEIEIALKAISGISDSLTLVRNEQLVSYIVAQSDVSTDQVRAQLRNSLPDYMIPSTVTILDRWPLTPNGKIDRNALPDPESNGRPPYVAPRTATEEKLVEIWSEVLGVEHIGVHDSFFDLGGHSLLAARAVAKFRQAFEVDIQLRSLFELHTIADIAQYLDTMKWAAQTAEQVSSGHSEEGRDEGFL
ncbi:MAG: non-ribosomal peptide synthetase, partial [Ketobacter sp.]|nr:non-ribosomal peptide synthetase [Ketobacter sp.]